MFSILLAEDDASLRHHLARALDRAGYMVATAGDGDEALAALHAASFDLLLTDIVMPGLDGIALAQRAGALYPAMRIMFITGFAAVTLERNDLPANARILSKPFHLRDLVAEVERLFPAPHAADG